LTLAGQLPGLMMPNVDCGCLTQCSAKRSGFKTPRGRRQRPPTRDEQPEHLRKGTNVKPNQTTVTRGPWNYGGLSGSGIDGYLIQPFRIRERAEFESHGLPFTGRCNFKVQRGQIYDTRVSLDKDGRAEDRRIGLLYGYIQHYCRNSCRFVMSRAARKRGMKTDDGMYNRVAKERVNVKRDDNTAPGV
jgi:hypothetical protein